MAVFEVGDLVRVVKDNSYPDYVGHTGSVTEVTPDDVYPYSVVFDKVPAGGSSFDVFSDAEIELLKPVPVYVVSTEWHPENSNKVVRHVYGPHSTRAEARRVADGFLREHWNSDQGGVFHATALKMLS